VTGPYAAYPAYGAVLEVMSGIQNLTGYGGGGKPQRLREMDVINGVGGACAVLTALFHRLKTGQGQHIDLSQVELPTHALLGEHLLEYALHATHAPPLGNRHRWFAPQGCYRCRGDDKWVTLTVRSDREWQRLCQAVGHPEWAEDSRFSTNEARVANHDEIDRLIEQWTRGRTHYEAVQILQRHAVPSGAVLTVEELAEDPHLRARGYFVQGVPGTDRVFMGMPWRTSACAPTVRWRGPDLGQHNEHFVCGQLGRPKEDVPVLRENELGTAYDPD
jgi:crotonobetainyl-CoA:carnitine CoA-transferase CaiB-like acyl-CoA transferase